ncbi:MAG: hypothetical protein CM15mP129_10380 [Chloroflexota bacterium]|nr:MAG: hypothetical protein CM15mP129_10380 [Chloroflexota bacterium]
MAGADKIFLLGEHIQYLLLHMELKLFLKVDLIWGPEINMLLRPKASLRLCWNDGLYGPTETLLLLKKSNDIDVCSDLIAQAEHDVKQTPY